MEHSIVETAATLLESCLVHDETFHDFYDGVPSSQGGKYLYGRHRVQRQKVVMIPREIEHKYSDIEYGYHFVGVFPEINRAYATMESTLYLWDYVNHGRWSVLNQFTDFVVCVGLVKPKSSVFVDDVQYILVVATRLQIHLIGLGFANNRVDGETRVHPTHYTVPTDEVLIQKIIGTEDGRIFMCCNAGNVYEFEYSFGSNFLGQAVRTCRKREASSSITRQVFKLIPYIMGGSNDPIIDMVCNDRTEYAYLFCLSASGVISAYHVGSGSVPTLVAEYSDALLDAQTEVTHLRFGQNTTLVSLETIDETESLLVRLVAVTNTGDRIFLTMTHAYSMYSIHFVFVRLRCPKLDAEDGSVELDPQRTANSPRDIHACFYRDGVSLFADMRSDTSDSLICVYRDSQRSKHHPQNFPTMFRVNQIFENVESVACEGRIYSIAEVPLPQFASPMAFHLFAAEQMIPHGRPLVGLSEFAIQQLISPRQFVCLTAKSVQQFQLLRPLDEIANILQMSGADTLVEKLQHFFQGYGIVEAGCMLLTIVCGNNKFNAQQQPVASRLALTWRETTTNAPDRAILLRQRAMDVYFRKVHLCIHDCEASSVGQPDPQTVFGNAGLSPRMITMYLYCSRLLRPIWRFSVAVIENETNVFLRFSQPLLNEMQQPLLKFQEFFESNFRRFLQRPQPMSSHQDVPSICDHAASTLEMMLKLVRRTVEVMSFLVVVSRRDKFDRMFSTLDEDFRTDLLQLPFSSIVTSQRGEDVIREAMRHLVPYLVQKEVEHLHREAPLFFKNTDLLYFSACEKLKTIHTPADAHDALQLLFDATQDPNFDVPRACERLRQVRFYRGVVQLIQHLSENLGPNVGGVSGSSADILRRKRLLWNEIFKCLDELIHLPGNQNEFDVEHVLRQCLQFPDKDFLFDMYQWFMDQNRLDILYPRNPPHLQDFLSDCHVSDRTDRLKKLVAFYDVIGDGPKLIELLDYLARLPGFSLQDRQQFLVRAQLACRGVQARGGQTPKAYKFEERVDLCRIQCSLLEMLEHMLRNRSLSPEMREPLLQSISKLSAELFDLNQLYAYAKEFGFWQIALDCLSFSNNETKHRSLIDSIWQRVVNEEITKGGYGNPEEQEYADRDWVKPLSYRIKILSEKYLREGKEWMFPHRTLLPKLESSNVEFNDNPVPGGIPRLLLHSGVDIGELVATYRNYALNLVTFSEVAQLNLLQSVCFVVGEVVDGHSVHRTKVHSRAILNKITIELVDQCLRQIGQLAPSDRIERFRFQLERARRLLER